MSEERDHFDFIEDELKLPRGAFLAYVAAPDDWSFVLKTHAILEATLNLMIERESGGRFEVFADEKVPLGRSFGAGKIGLAVSLGLLPKQTAELLDALTILRNMYAHDPRHASRKIAEIVPLAKDPKLLASRIKEAPHVQGVRSDDWRLRVLISTMQVLFALVKTRVGQIEAEGQIASDNELAEAISQHWDRAISDMKPAKAGNARTFDYVTGTWPQSAKAKRRKQRPH